MQVAAAPAKISLRHVSLMREISAYSSAIADVALSEPWLAILPVVLYGSREMQDELLPDYLAGRLLPAFALSEPGAGSDAAAITTTAHRDGDHYVIDGHKTWTSNCGLADLYVVFARMKGLSGTGGISAFAVDGGEPGIVLEERLSVLPPHTVGTWVLENCRVPARRLIGELGQGFKIAMRVLELFRPTVGAATLGLARRAMEEATKRSLDRTAFNKPIAEHQLIQAKLADMAVGIDRRRVIGLPRGLATRRHRAKHCARSSNRKVVLDRDGFRDHRSGAADIRRAWRGARFHRRAPVSALAGVSNFQWNERDSTAYHRQTHSAEPISVAVFALNLRSKQSACRRRFCTSASSASLCLRRADILLSFAPNKPSAGP